MRDSRGISEVLGSVILLVITVATFAVLFLLVQGVPKPSPGINTDLQATLEHPSSAVWQVSIVHLGGAELKDPDAGVVIAVNNTTLSYNVTQGLTTSSIWGVGRTWRITLPLPVAPETRVVVSVISYAANQIIYTAELQAGYTSTGGAFPPMVSPAWAVSSENTNHVRNDGQQTYRIHAVVIDPDGNLNATSGVWAEITVIPQGGAQATIAIGTGRYNLSRTQGSHYQSADLVVGAAVAAGTYQITVRAQDAAGGNGSALTPPLLVVASGSAAGPTLVVNGTSVAPISVNTSAVNIGMLRLNITAQGGDANLGQIVVTKGGTLSDAQVTLELWADGDGSGTFDPSADVLLTPPTGFTAGTANIFGVPIVTLTAGSTRVLFVVADLAGATDGTNLTLALGGSNSIRGTDVPGGAAAAVTGTFPVATTDVVVGSKLTIDMLSGAPDRLLVNSVSVRFLEFELRAAGEPFAIKKINVTLTGTVARSSAQCTIKINGTAQGGSQNFDPGRVARFSINYVLSDTAGLVPLEVFITVSGQTSRTVGIQIASESQTFATGQISGKGRNGKSPEAFPLDSGLVAVVSTGNLSVDEWNDTALSTSVRSGMNSVYLHTFKLRAHGESIDFNRMVFYQTGNLTDAQFAAITIRVRGGPWFSGTFFSGVVTWDAGASGKLFNIPINATNSGEALVDVYANLSTGTQAKEFSLSILDSAKVRGWGKTSSTALYAGAESAPYPLTVGARRIQGDVLLWGTNLAPTTILAPASLVPIMKVTVRAVGENMTLDEVFLRSIPGGPSDPASVTVHFYRDVNNDTTTAIQGDDVEVSPSEAGPFGTDTLKAFAPGANLTAGSDANFVFAMDFTVAATGFNMETRVNASNGTIRGTYSGTTIPPNSQNGITNPTTLLVQTPGVPVVDRGTLAVAGTNLNDHDHVHSGATGKVILRVALTAAIESVRVESVKVHLSGNVSASAITVHLWWDKDKSGTVNAGDVELGTNATFASGDVTFSASPLMTVGTGSPEHLLVVIDISGSAALDSTCGIEVSLASFLGASGSASTLGIIPTGTFPMSSPTVPVQV